MKKQTRILVVLALAPFISAWQETEGAVPAPTQPGEERTQQDALPQSKDPLWGNLGQCRVGYDDKAGLYTIAVTPQVKQLSGTQVSASGFILPLDSSDKTRHFLLTKRTPVCLYCAPGEPNEVIEVYATKALDWTDDLIHVTGTFELINNGDQGIFFKIDKASTETSTTIDRFMNAP